MRAKKIARMSSAQTAASQNSWQRVSTAGPETVKWTYFSSKRNVVDELWKKPVTRFN